MKASSQWATAEPAALPLNVQKRITKAALSLPTPPRSATLPLNRQCVMEGRA
ncbi:MAG: hypothetical protein IH621_16765 [Krumholzibacteria bacterium]|nr:hypothetical protein [Candidatus Krumholzibacteria bacterium]